MSESAWVEGMGKEFSIEASQFENSEDGPVCPACEALIFRVRNSTPGRGTPMAHELVAVLDTDGDVQLWEGFCTGGEKLVIFND